MILLEDKAQKENKHIIKNEYWKSKGIKVERVPLPVGDYVIANEKTQDVMKRKSTRGTYDVCVDSKYSIDEIVQDVAGKQHDRFKDELLLAQNNGIKLHIVIENEGGLIKYTRDVYNPTITCLDDLHSWKNPRLFIRKSGKQLYPRATRGITLQKILYTMQEKYGCEFHFCTPKESGRLIVDLLKG